MVRLYLYMYEYTIDYFIIDTGNHALLTEQMVTSAHARAVALDSICMLTIFLSYFISS